MTDKEEKEFISNPVEAYENVVKQLTRKTQECERSRKRISDLEERIINHSNEIEEYCSRLADKDKECEELKAYAQRQENQREEYYKEYLKKDKALEEIEGIVKNFGSYAAWQEQRINKILDIINKAKGEGNEDT